MNRSQLCLVRHHSNEYVVPVRRPQQSRKHRPRHQHQQDIMNNMPRASLVALLIVSVMVALASRLF